MTAFASPSGEPPRDRWGRYLITPADGGKPKGHTRATTIAKACADEGALIRWKQRMAVLGVASRPDLLAGVQAASPDDRKTLDGLCEQGMDAAAASSSANLGTAIHAFTERVLLGGDLADVPEQHRPDVAAIVAAIDSIGGTVVPGMVERIVVLADLEVAGTFDFAVRLPDRDLPVICDLKTGRSVDYGAGDWSIQLALYAHADTLWDAATDTHEPMIPVDQNVGLIFHAPAGTGTCTVHDLDLRAGWEQVPVCMAVRDWRKRGRKLLTAHTVTPTLDLEQPEPVTHTDAISDERHAFLLGRAKALVDMLPGGEQQFMAGWPAGVPTFYTVRTTDATHSADDLDAIAAHLSRLEAAVEAPFGSDLDPAGPVLPSDPRIVELRQRWEHLPADLAHDVSATYGDRHPLSSGKATVRDLDVMADAIAAAEKVAGDRASIAAVHLAALPDTVSNEWIAKHVKVQITDAAIRATDLTADRLDRLGDLCDACLPETGPLLVADGDGLAAAPDALDRLIDRWGSKSALLTEARRIASDLGLDPITGGTAGIPTSVPLVARLAVTDVAA